MERQIQARRKCVERMICKSRDTGTSDKIKNPTPDRTATDMESNVNMPKKVAAKR